MVDVAKLSLPIWQFIMYLLLSVIVFIVALAWNDFARATADKYFNTEENNLALMYYAIGATVLLIVVGYSFKYLAPKAIAHFD